MAISIAPTQLRAKSPTLSLLSVRTPGGFLFTCSLLVLGLTLLAWVGLEAYKAKLTGDKERIESEVAALQAKRPAGIQTDILRGVARFTNIQNLLGKHRDAAGVLLFLEQSVQPDVRFVDFSMDFNLQALSISAEGAGYDGIARQMVAFEKDKRVVRVVLSDVAHDATTNIARGRLVVSFTPEAFVVKPE